MGKPKGSKIKGSEAGAVTNFDESIDRLPTEPGLSAYSDKIKHNYKGTPPRDMSVLTTGSQNVFHSSIYSTDEYGTTGDRLNTDRFKATHAHESSMIRGSCYGQSSRVEYVDLNGQLLDPEKLRSSNMLPGQGSTRITSEYTSPPPFSPPPYTSPSPQPEQDFRRGQDQRPAMPAHTLEEPYFQRTYGEELGYANNIGMQIQERYAVLPSEFTQVRSVFLPISPSRRQSLYDQQQQPSPSSPVRSYTHDAYESPADFTGVYRIVERRGRTLINDVLLDPVTGASVPIQMVEK